MMPGPKCSIWLLRGTTQLTFNPCPIFCHYDWKGVEQPTPNIEQELNTRCGQRSPDMLRFMLLMTWCIRAVRGFFPSAAMIKHGEFITRWRTFVEMCRGTSGNAPCLHHGLHLNKTRWLGADFLWEPRAREIPFEAESCIANFDFGNLFCTCAELASSLCCMWLVDVM